MCAKDTLIENWSNGEVIELTVDKAICWIEVHDFSLKVGLPYSYFKDLFPVVGSIFKYDGKREIARII